MTKTKGFILASLLFLGAGCAAISSQHNTMMSMQDYTFSESPEDVFAGAVALFNSDGMPLDVDGDLSGVSPWRTKYKSQGSLSHNEKVRYRVTVSAVDENKTTVRVMKESIPEKSDPVNIGRMLGSEMLTPTTMRDLPFEYRILHKVNPSAAAALKADAETQ